jgi:hypothetical protein
MSIRLKAEIKLQNMGIEGMGYSNFYKEKTVNQELYK